MVWHHVTFNHVTVCFTEVGLPTYPSTAIIEHTISQRNHQCMIEKAESFFYHHLQSLRRSAYRTGNSLDPGHLQTERIAMFLIPVRPCPITTAENIHKYKTNQQDLQ